MEWFYFLLLAAQLVIPVVYTTDLAFTFPVDKKPLSNLEIISGGNYYPQGLSDWKLVDPNYYKYASGPQAPPNFYSPSASSSNLNSFPSKFCEFGHIGPNRFIQPEYTNFQARPQGYIAVPVFSSGPQHQKISSRHGAGRSINFSPISSSASSYSSPPQSQGSQSAYLNANFIYPNEQYAAQSLNPEQRAIPSNPASRIPLVLVPVKTDSLVSIPCPQQSDFTRDPRNYIKENSYQSAEPSYPYVHPNPTNIPYQPSPIAQPPTQAIPAYQPSSTPQNDFSIAYTKRGPVSLSPPQQQEVSQRNERALYQATFQPTTNQTTDESKPAPAVDTAEEQKIEGGDSTVKPQLESTASPSDESATAVLPEDMMMTTVLIKRIAKEIQTANNNDPTTLILRDNSMPSDQVNLIPSDH